MYDLFNKTCFSKYWPQPQTINACCYFSFTLNNSSRCYERNDRGLLNPW
jgi:hypothetical protein